MVSETSPRCRPDILERAKAADIDSLAGTDWGALREIVQGLIAEVERLRSENRELKKTDVWANDVIKEHESLNARIKALEAEAQEYHDKKEEALTLCAGQNRYIERLEAEFLEATKEIVYAIHEGRDAPEGEDVYAEKVAREALEQLRAEDKIGGGDGE